MSSTEQRINKILFVDDEKGMHEIFRILFKNEIRSGLYSVEYFTSGLQCLDYIKKSDKIDNLIVLTDITMPVMDGFDLLTQIKEYYSVIPVIVISAYESSLYIEKAKKLGALAYYTKPLEVSELKELLGRLNSK